jgi:hypothetical protein
MRKRILARLVSIGCYALLGLAFTLPCAGRASATTSTCPTTEYCSSQGSTTAPGTYIGTVGTDPGDFLQIGDLTIYNNSATSPCCDVGGTTYPSSYYEFYWGGGGLLIVGEMGNNGTVPNGIDMELYSYNGSTETLVPGASIYFPQTPPPGTPNFNPQNLFNGNLAAGYYSIDTFPAATDSPTGDPVYQVAFTPGVVNTPEPSSAALLGMGMLAMFGLVGFTKRRSGVVASETI